MNTRTADTLFVAAAQRFVRFFRILGPGLVTGAADDNPSGISTYSVAGATTGFSMLGLTLISTPMMAVIQGMCARISMLTGEGLAALMRRRLPLPMAYSLAALVIVANTFNVGADLGGMADAAHLVLPLPVDAWVFFFIGLIGAQVWLSYALIARFFKWLTLSLFAYIVTAFVVHPLMAAPASPVRHASIPFRFWLAFNDGRRPRHDYHPVSLLYGKRP
ncbi:MAG: divalent metal cation transporter [Candidatus Cybelea sp.]|jgi:Mn2+/Fe2+ NRAMP family transporter